MKMKTMKNPKQRMIWKMIYASLLHYTKVAVAVIIATVIAIAVTTLAIAIAAMTIEIAMMIAMIVLVGIVPMLLMMMGIA